MPFDYISDHVKLIIRMFQLLVKTDLLAQIEYAQIVRHMILI